MRYIGTKSEVCFKNVFLQKCLGLEYAVFVHVGKQ